MNCRTPIVSYFWGVWMELDEKWGINCNDRSAQGGEPSKAGFGSPSGRGKSPQTWQTNKVGLLWVLRQKTWAVWLFRSQVFQKKLCLLDIPLQLKYTGLDKTGILPCECFFFLFCHLTFFYNCMSHRDTAKLLSHLISISLSLFSSYIRADSERKRTKGECAFSPLHFKEGGGVWVKDLSDSLFHFLKLKKWPRKSHKT